MLCCFTSLLLMDNHHSSSLLMDMYLFPRVQKIPIDREAEFCPGSHWGGNLTQEQLNRATCCCSQAAFNIFLGYLLQRPLSGAEEPVHALGVCSFTCSLCFVRLAAPIKTLKCLLPMLGFSCPCMTEGISHTSMQGTQRWHRKTITMYSSKEKLSQLMQSGIASCFSLVTHCKTIQATQGWRKLSRSFKEANSDMSWLFRLHIQPFCL